MTGIGADGPGRNSETVSSSEAASIDIRQIARVAAVTVNLRDGFRNEPRSPEYRAIHGLSPDASDTHEDWVARLHPEDRARTVQQFLDAVKGTAGQFTYQYRIIRPSDGQVRWIATVARIERGPDGASRCGWSARTSTSPISPLRRKHCARAKSGSG